MKWLAAMLMLGAVACAPPSKPICLSKGIPVRAMGEPNKPLDVTIGIETICSGAETNVPVADEITLELFDPDGNPFPFKQGPLTRQNGNTIPVDSVVVTFTPDREGGWRLSAKLEPAIGNTTQLIQVVDYRADAGSRTIEGALLPFDCLRYTQTRSGTVLCASMQSQELTTQSGQAFTATAAAVAGDTVWVVKTIPSGVVERWVEGDAGTFEKTHTQAFASSLVAVLAVAPDESLWLEAFAEQGKEHLMHLSPEQDGGLKVDTTVLNQVFVFGIAAGSDRVFGVGETQLVVLNQVDGGVKTTPRNGDEGRELRGADARTVWTTTSGTGVLHATSMQAGATVVRDSMELPAGTLGFQRKEPTLVPRIPLLSLEPPNAAIPEVVDGKIVLRGYRAKEGFNMISATDKHIYARSAASPELQVIDR